jgi:hypothetical protein
MNSWFYGPVNEGCKSKKFADEANHTQSQVLSGPIIVQLLYFKVYIMTILRKIAIIIIYMDEVSFAGSGNWKFVDDVAHVNHAQSRILKSQFVNQSTYFKTYTMFILRKSTIIALHLDEVWEDRRIRSIVANVNQI